VRTEKWEMKGAEMGKIEEYTDSAFPAFPAFLLPAFLSKCPNC